MAEKIPDAWVDAAATLLDRAGLAGLTITAIAKEAGVSRVTLHRHGATVDDYVIAALGRASEDLRSSLWPVLTGTGSGIDRLREALAIVCEVSDRHAGIMMAMFGAPAWPLPDQPGRTTSFEFIEPFERLVRDGVSDGSLDSDDPLADATLVANAVAWTYLHMRHAHRWDHDRAVARVVAMATSLVASAHVAG